MSSGSEEPRLDYDEMTVATMLAALRACPADKRMDSMAVFFRIFTEDAKAELFGLRVAVESVRALIPGHGSVYGLHSDQVKDALSATEQTHLLIPRSALTNSQQGGSSHV